MRYLHIHSIILLFITFNLNAQITCTNASTITTGITTVDSVINGQVPNPDCAENFGQLRTGGRWYSYTASVDGVAKVTTNLNTNPNTDTRLHIYTGNCSSLQCIAGNDDIDAFGNNRASEVLWPVNLGETYYIGWDNQWTTNGFNFELLEVAVTCPDGNGIITSDFDDINEFIACFTTEDVDNNGATWKLQSIDLDGDNTNEDYTTNGSNANISKNDWLFSSPINLISGNEYNINFKYNGANGTFPANENLDVLLVDAPNSSANILSIIFTDTNISSNGEFNELESLATTQDLDYISTATGTYFLAFNATSLEDTGSLLLFDFSFEENTLSINEENNPILYSYNHLSETLTISSKTSSLNSITITNTLGQVAFNDSLNSNMEQLDLSILNNGIYSIRVSNYNSEKIIKFLKY